MVHDVKYFSFEQLLSSTATSPFNTLADFSRGHASHSTLVSSLPIMPAYFTTFLDELAQCGGVVDWVSKFAYDEDLRHEVDILKSKVVGNRQLVTLLGDLDAVRSWILLLGIAPEQKNRLPPLPHLSTNNFH